MDFKKARAGEVEARVKAAYEKLQEVNKDINAVVTFVDPSEQLEELKKIDEHAPMYGLPIVLKDNVNTKGIRTTASSRILDNYIPVYDAHIVDKLKQAGAVVIAKTSMDELGMGGTNKNAYTGSVHNPWNPARISGGSSGGSAAAVASGAVSFAIGTDTGDSIRKPAAFNGVVGVKPTYGRISRYGIIPYASSLDHVGYFTTSVKDACVALEVLAGRDDRDMTSSLREVEAYHANVTSDLHGKRIALLENVQEEVRPEIKENMDQLVKKLEERGAIVDTVRMNEDGESVEDVMIHSRTKGFSSYVRKRFVIGSYSLYAENQEKVFRKAQKIRRLIVNELAAVLEQYDAVLASASGDIAPLSEASHDASLHTSSIVAENYMVLGNFSGYPSISVPSGFVEGMPIGVNLTTKAFDEQTMFNIALAIEEICGLEGNDVEVAA